jgi:hypothetical protein
MFKGKKSFHLQHAKWALYIESSTQYFDVSSVQFHESNVGKVDGHVAKP